MRVQTSVLVGAACLSGGIDVSVGGGAAAFLPWDATAAAATPSAANVATLATSAWAMASTLTGAADGLSCIGVEVEVG